MHKCSRNCHLSAVNELLNYVKRHEVGKVENFANIPNNIGESSLHLSARKGDKNNVEYHGEDLKIIQLLMENGSDVFVETNEVYLIRFFHILFHCLEN